jgi:hypothetical protein
MSDDTLATLERKAVDDAHADNMGTLVKMLDEALNNAKTTNDFAEAISRAKLGLRRFRTARAELLKLIALD